MIFANNVLTSSFTVIKEKPWWGLSVTVDSSISAPLCAKLLEKVSTVA